MLNNIITDIIIEQGYPANPAGVCFGITNMWAQAVLSGEETIFNERNEWITYVYQESLQEYEKEGFDIRDPKLRSILIKHMLKTLVDFRVRKSDLQAYTDSVFLFQSPIDFSQQHIPFTYQNSFGLPSKLALSKKIEEEGGLVKIHDEIISGDINEIQDYFDQLTESLSNIDKKILDHLVIIVSGYSHAVGLRYIYPDRWEVADSNKYPFKIVDSSKLTKFLDGILVSGKSINCIDISFITTEKYKINFKKEGLPTFEITLNRITEEFDNYILLKDFIQDDLKTLVKLIEEDKEVFNETTKHEIIHLIHKYGIPMLTVSDQKNLRNFIINSKNQELITKLPPITMFDKIFTFGCKSQAEELINNNFFDQESLKNKALCLSIIYKKHDIINMLLQSKLSFEPEYEFKKNYSLKNIAIERGDFKSIKYLKEEVGAKIDYKSALKWAVYNDDINMLLYLQFHNPMKEIFPDYDSLYTKEHHLLALALANGRYQYKLIRYLSEQGFDLNFIDEEGRSAAHIAILKTEGLPALLSIKTLNRLDNYQHGFNKKDSNGLRPIHLAAKLDNLDLVKYLSTNLKVPLNQKSDNGDTIAHFAVLSKQTKVLSWLAEQNTELLFLPNSKNESPLNLAKTNNCLAAGSIILMMMKPSNGKVNAEIFRWIENQPLETCIAIAENLDNILGEKIKHTLIEDTLKKVNILGKILFKNKSIASMFASRETLERKILQLKSEEYNQYLYQKPNRGPLSRR